jgi:hypothetical protein
MWKESGINCVDMLPWRLPADAVKSHKTPRPRKTEVGTYKLRLVPTDCQKFKAWVLHEPAVAVK